MKIRIKTMNQLLNSGYDRDLYGDILKENRPTIVKRMQHILGGVYECLQENDRYYVAENESSWSLGLDAALEVMDE